MNVRLQILPGVTAPSKVHGKTGGAYTPTTAGIVSVSAGDAEALIESGNWQFVPPAPSFVSTEQTGNGAQQSIAHGLGVVPSKVVAFMTGNPASPGASSIVAGTHDATSCLFTVTSNFKYVVMAWA